MDAVLRIDLILRGAVGVFQPFINARRAIARGRSGEDLQLADFLQLEVAHLQVNRLVLGMVGKRLRHRAQPVEADHIVRLGIGNRLVQVGPTGFRGIAAVLHCERQTDPEVFEPQVGPGQQSSQGAAELGDDRLEIAHHAQFLFHPAGFVDFGIGGQLVVTALTRDCVGGGFGGHHPALHRGVAALDPGHVEEARSAADQRAPRESQLGQRLPTAIADRPRTIGYAPPAFKYRGDFGVSLPLLERLERRHIRIAVAEPDDVAESNLVPALMIEEPAAEAVLVFDRPALGMDHAARRVLFGGNVPQFLEPESVDLRLRIGVEIVLCFELLGEMTACAFCEEGVLGVEFDPRLVIALVAAILGHAHVLRRHAFDRTVVVIEHFARREAGEDLHSQPLGLFGQPAAQVAKAAGVGALVVHERRRDEMRDREFLFGGKRPVLVIGHRGLGHRAAVIAPSRQQFVERLGIDHRAGEDVRTDFRAFFEHADGEVSVDLFEPDRRSQASRPASYDHHVIRHRFAFAHGFTLPIGFSARTLDCCG